MKKSFIFTLFLATSVISFSQENIILAQNTSDFSQINTNAILNSENPISRFALSASPLGFLQFGPMINAEIGLTGNLVLNTHVRFPSYGLLSYLIRKAFNDGSTVDELSGIAPGGGLIYLFGDRQGKPYIGILVEYEKTNVLYDKGEYWERTETNRVTPIVFNGGYRFIFNGGFFINTGLLIGSATAKSEWKYSNPTYTNYLGEHGGENKRIIPFGMIEVAFGVEF